MTGWLYLYGPATAAVALVAAVWLWHPVRARLTDLRAFVGRLCDENLALEARLQETEVRANRAESVLQEIRELVAPSADLLDDDYALTVDIRRTLRSYDHPEEEYELL